MQFEKPFRTKVIIAREGLLFLLFFVVAFIITILISDAGGGMRDGEARAVFVFIFVAFWCIRFVVWAIKILKQATEIGQLMNKYKNPT